ncbi:murein hydrolase activator EnvC family protein [Algoriphagus sediminis]|uniref:Peptidoglycan DD-metalloendopeptidase family protein n=1 Tax=Algoriphagus sediminis TaxID=3057113 RepID=A0ABT7Y8S1_9BACT|nr:peptidoglycan DD-metalloendopeptidase family protein [Algoriphagus sediminis]MDN3202830.1 peptidoglycan DD-metalloendopeptidase family protein [Algoriphagus sediminis]
MRRFFSGILIIIFSGLIWIAPTQAQTKKTRAQLESEKREVQERLKEFDKILKRTTATKNATIGELNAITRQFQAQNKLVNTLDREVKLIDQEIEETESKIKQNEQELKELKEEYARMIYNASKMNRGLSIVAFVFSSSNFNQLYMRLRYLKQYTDSRKQQAVQIEKLTAELAEQRVILDGKKDEKVAVLAEAEKERAKLQAMRQERQGVVNTLTSKERQVQRQIAETRKQQAQLNQMIKDVIAEEIRLAEAAAAKENPTVKKSTGSSMPLTPEAAALSSSFAGNKGKLPWPVETGFVSQQYGTHAHPTLKGITIENDGLDIRTEQGSPVRSVFDGTVTKITNMPGFGGTIIIKHGEYYTMYSKLKTISVKTGQKVVAKDIIGEVATQADGQAEVHFQTWKGLTKMNPATWIAPK